jgi:hypothetical protein
MQGEAAAAALLKELPPELVRLEAVMVVGIAGQYNL